MGAPVTEIVAVPRTVKNMLSEIQDELNWFIREFKDLGAAEDLAELQSVLPTVMDYAEDLHAGMEDLERLVEKLVS